MEMRLRGQKPFSQQGGLGPRTVSSPEPNFFLASIELSNSCQAGEFQEDSRMFYTAFGQVLQGYGLKDTIVETDTSAKMRCPLLIPAEITGEKINKDKLVIGEIKVSYPCNGLHHHLKHWARARIFIGEMSVVLQKKEV